MYWILGMGHPPSQELPEQQHDQRKTDDHQGDGRQNAGQRASLWPKHLFLSSYFYQAA
jgi:hypothetical protein